MWITAEATSIHKFLYYMDVAQGSVTLERGRPSERSLRNTFVDSHDE